MIIDEDFYLEHFGIKGMRWGIRKNTFIPLDMGGPSKIKDGVFIAKNILKQIGSKKVSDIPSIKELTYSRGYQITNIIQTILDATS